MAPLLVTQESYRIVVPVSISYRGKCPRLRAIEAAVSPLRFLMFALARFSISSLHIPMFPLLIRRLHMSKSPYKEKNISSVVFSESCKNPAHILLSILCCENRSHLSSKSFCVYICPIFYHNRQGYLIDHASVAAETVSSSLGGSNAIFDSTLLIKASITFAETT